MGIIKTAMMMGGGIYAINKISKTVERRPQGTPSNNNQYDDRGYIHAAQSHQGSQGPPSFQQGSGRNADDQNQEDIRPQQAYFLSNDNAWTPLPQGHPVSKANDVGPGPQRGYPDGALDGPHMLMPPTHVNQQKRSFVFPQDQGSENQVRSPSPLPALAGKGMDYAMNGAGGKSNKNGGGKGSDMLAGLFSK